MGCGWVGVCWGSNKIPMNGALEKTYTDSLESREKKDFANVASHPPLFSEGKYRYACAHTHHNIFILHMHCQFLHHTNTNSLSD